MTELDILKEVFLAPNLDEETRRENEDQIAAWERAFLEHEELRGWREHDVKERIARQAEDS